MTECLDDASRRNRILPIGGPGEAITPRDQADHLFALLKRKPSLSSVPVALLDLDAATGQYDAVATPSTGTETVFDFYARLIDGEASIERGDHAGSVPIIIVNPGVSPMAATRSEHRRPRR